MTTVSNPTMAETEEEILARLDQADVLLDVKGLCVDYVTETGNIRACDDVSFVLKRGEILGVAGESASGKSTLLNAVGRLQRPPAVTSAGQIWYHGADTEPIDLAAMSKEELQPYRWTRISIVMQSAMACLNPVVRLGAQFTDVLMTHNPRLKESEATERAGELLEIVGIPADRLTSFPFELSGGMQRRALIALSLACDPDLVLMDEPTTAVDVVMQRQILEQVLEAQARLGFAIIFVTHDLSLLLEISDRLAIMYGGRLVEVGTAAQLYEKALHPYTRALRRSFPPLSEPVRRLSGIPGSPPDLLDLPPGCAFAPRCEHAMELCHQKRPELREVTAGRSACWLTNGDLSADEIAAQNVVGVSRELAEQVVEAPENLTVPSGADAPQETREESGETHD